MRFAMTRHNAERNALIGKQHCLDPFGADISAERRDKKAVFTSLHGKKAVSVDLSEVAGPPWPVGGPLPQVTVRYRRSVDDDFSVVDPHRKPAQRLTDRARTTFLWTVDCHDRAAFRKAVAFVDGNAQ